MQAFDHGARVIIAGDIDDTASTGTREAAVRERVRPGMTGTVLFTDGQGTTHIQWDAGFRRGVEQTQAGVLRRVVAAANAKAVTEVHDVRGPFLVVCTDHDPGDKVRRGWAHCPGCFLKHYNPDADGGGQLVWTAYQSGARRFGAIEHALRAWRGEGPLSSYAIAIIEAP